MMDFVMCLITRAMGISAMTTDERQVYLEWVRNTANSQLACLVRDMVHSGTLQNGIDRFQACNLNP